MGTFTLRIEGEEGVESVPLPPGEHRLGRAEDLAVRVEEVRASREHLELRVGQSGIDIRDLGSTNGTFVGERRILAARIAPGDSFRIGHTTFTLVEEASPVSRGRRSRPVWATAATILGPAIVLLILSQIGLSERRSSRQREVVRARDREAAALERIVDLEFIRARDDTDPRRSEAALVEFLRRNPGSTRRSEAEAALQEIRARSEAIRSVEERVAGLAADFEADRLTFSEYHDELEMLMATHGREPEILAVVRPKLADLRRSLDDAQGDVVADACAKVMGLADKGMFGRAIRSLNAFADGHPEEAAAFHEEIRSAEGKVLALGEAQYREVLDLAGKLVADGKRREAAQLIMAEQPRFAGTRFGMLLGLHAGLYGSHREVGRGEAPPPDQISLRRSYHLLAREAEELAAAGLFRESAKKYESMVEGITLPAVRDEFALRAAELEGLAGLIDTVRERIAERGPRFGSVDLESGKFSVRGIEDGQLVLKGRGGEFRRPWADLEPADVLALIRKARLPVASRLLVAVYCAEMNLFEAFDAEIVAALERENLREAAGRLFARTEGSPYPSGGYVAHNGRVLTRAEYAEVVHRERITALRDRQADVLGRIEGHGVFKKLAKLRELRLDLDKARSHALELIFDTVKYFYPYRDRMKEYTPVQKEVAARVAVVLEAWEKPLRVTLKADGSLSALIKDAEEVSAELEKLGIDNREFKRALGDLTMYLDRTLTVQTYFHDRVEMILFEYDRKMLEWNALLETVATDPERRQIEVTNLYRIMMGRRALAIDDRLVKSARGHSEEMGRLGYFGHFSPIKERRTPQQRMQLEGYKGSGMSENCHGGSGSPEGAHAGWCRSSGHHRNILQTAWTEMGSGHSGRLWTQNFGRTKPKVFPEERQPDDDTGGDK